MKKIELTSYEANDLIRVLQYAIEKKKEDYTRGKMNEKKLYMEIDDIRCIMARIPKEYIERVEQRRGKPKLQKLIDETKKQSVDNKDEDNLLDL